LALEYIKHIQVQGNAFSNVFEDTLVLFKFQDDFLRLWDLKTNTLIEKFLNFEYMNIYSLKILCSKDHILAFQQRVDGCVCHIWEKIHPSKINILNIPTDILGPIFVPFLLFKGFIIFNVFTSSSKYEGTTQIWDICKRSMLKEYEGGDILVLKEQFLVIWNPTEELQKLNFVHIWDMLKSKHVVTIEVSRFGRWDPYSYNMLNAYMDEEDSLILNTETVSFTFSNLTETKKNKKFHFF
jgi:WD40 repeat protein